MNFRRSFAFLLMIQAFLAGSPVQSIHSQTSDPGTKFRLAQGLEQAGEYERAAGLYQKLLSEDPSSYVLFEALQRTWMQLKRYDDVVLLLRNRLMQAPSDVNLRAVLGSVYYRAGREKEASVEWDSVIATDPTNPGTYRLIATILTENRLLERAAEVYRRGRITIGDTDLFSMELAQLFAAEMDYGSATTEYLRWLKQNPTQLSFVQTRLAQFTAKEEARIAALNVIRTALKDREGLPLLELLAWLEMEGKKFEDAFEAYRRIDNLSTSHGSGLYQFAERAYHEKAYEIAARAYQEAINAPLPAVRMPYARFGYASALKELNTQADTFASPVRSTPATEAIPLYGGTVALFRKIIEDYPRTEFSAKSYYQIGLIQFEKFGDGEGAISSFEHVFEEVGNVPALRHDAELMIGRIQLARGDTVNAVTHFSAVAAAADALPDQRDEAIFHQAEIDYFGDQFDSAVQKLDALEVNLKANYANDALRLQSFLQENIKTAPDALRQFARADFLARQGKNTEAVAVLLSVIQLYPQAPLVDDALMEVGSLQAAAGLFPEAIVSYNRLLTEFKESSIALDRAQFRLAEVYQFGLQDATKAVSAYEKLLADYPSSILADEARKRVRQLRGEIF